jgi:SET domain-containing protein
MTGGECVEWRERVVVRSSPIDGKGVFAARRIRVGAHIGTFEGDPTTRDGLHVLWVLGDDGRYLGIRGHNALRYLNHSSGANAELRGTDLYALRNIQSGREITLDYGPDWEGVD